MVEKVRWRSVKSSNVCRVGWDSEQHMYVAYGDGSSIYRYDGVSRQRAVACAYAKSVGKYVNHVIKPRFTAVRIAG